MGAPALSATIAQLLRRPAARDRLLLLVPVRVCAAALGTLQRIGTERPNRGPDMAAPLALCGTVGVWVFVVPWVAMRSSRIAARQSVASNGAPLSHYGLQKCPARHRRVVRSAAIPAAWTRRYLCQRPDL